MSELFNKVQLFAKLASIIKHTNIVIHVVPREDIEELNRTIVAKIEQNKKEFR